MHWFVPAYGEKLFRNWVGPALHRGRLQERKGRQRHRENCSETRVRGSQCFFPCLPFSSSRKTSRQSRAMNATPPAQRMRSRKPITQAAGVRSGLLPPRPIGGHRSIARARPVTFLSLSRERALPRVLFQESLARPQVRAQCRNPVPLCLRKMSS